MNGKYRLTHPALALISVDDHHEGVTIAADSTIELNGKKFDGQRVVDVVWNGKLVMMFVDELKFATVAD
jgi:hypothetical protein